MKKNPTHAFPLRYFLLAVSLLTLLTASALVAKYITNSGEKVNSLATKQVSCEATEDFDGVNKTSITVKNTSSVDVYIRVRLVSYWQTPSGQIAGKNCTVPTFTLGDGWIKGENDTYYYKYRVLSAPSAPNSTTNLLKDGTEMTLKTEDGYIQVVKVLAEAIQADGKIDGKTPAVQDAWSEVTVSGDELQLINNTP